MNFGGLSWQEGKNSVPSARRSAANPTKDEWQAEDQSCFLSYGTLQDERKHHKVSGSRPSRTAGLPRIVILSGSEGPAFSSVLVVVR